MSSADRKLSASEVVKLLVGTLGRVMHPGLVKEAVKQTATSLGITDVDDAIKSALPSAAAGASTAAAALGNDQVHGNGKGQKKEKSGRTGRMVPYTLFITKVMDKIAHDPSYALPKAEEGEPATKRMKIASVLWSNLTDDNKKLFNEAYQPFCEQLTKDMVSSGHKTENLLQRISDFEKTLPDATRNALKAVLPVKASVASSMMAAAVKAASTKGAEAPGTAGKPAAAKPSATPAAKAAAQAPAAKPTAAAEDSDDDDSEESSEDEKSKKKDKKGKDKKKDKGEDKKRKRKEAEAKAAKSAKATKQAKKESSSSSSSDSDSSSSSSSDDSSSSDGDSE
eukprot:CAMPEP_0202898546 /NCGR_PEP_ID=MMETSP1392-20130828/7043_1 /ASSEMBLY_ACC=CAM_ASM_000868 /TAXON_ID=225041 /ORGANISM="Chlamydomonas chlamydogama, Strain SAG 11-48b" /LENGTH=337 /DNA_ID=CAMNT_0049584507 /DNA_START=27 /DNA_END=1040 /DNA_ORIENTATION=-